MEIILARSAGFCFGVKRATQMAFEAAEHHPTICSLGPIIHSPQLVDRLADKGVSVIRQVEEIPEGAVIIRSHGVTAPELNSIHERHLCIVDATCPFVKKAQEYVGLLRLRRVYRHPGRRKGSSRGAGSDFICRGRGFRRCRPRGGGTFAAAPAHGGYRADHPIAGEPASQSSASVWAKARSCEFLIPSAMPQWCGRRRRAPLPGSLTWCW